MKYDEMEGRKSFGLHLEELLERAFTELDEATKDVMLIPQFVVKLTEYIRGI